PAKAVVHSQPLGRAPLILRERSVFGVGEIRNAVRQSGLRRGIRYTEQKIGERITCARRGCGIVRIVAGEAQRTRCPRKLEEPEAVVYRAESELHRMRATDIGYCVADLIRVLRNDFG